MGADDAGVAVELGFVGAERAEDPIHRVALDRHHPEAVVDYRLRILGAKSPHQVDEVEQRRRARGGPEAAEVELRQVHAHARLGGTLEDIQSGREARIEELYAVLTPLRVMLGKQPWIGGDQPLYHDYIVFGTLQWPRVTSKLALLKQDDKVTEWFGRMLGLYDGLGASMPAAA